KPFTSYWSFQNQMRPTRKGNPSRLSRVVIATAVLMSVWSTWTSPLCSRRNCTISSWLLYLTMGDYVSLVIKSSFLLLIKETPLTTYLSPEIASNLPTASEATTRSSEILSEYEWEDYLSRTSASKSSMSQIR